MNVIKLDEEAIYHVAHSIAPGEAREAYLGQVCGDDATLRYRIEALLRVCEQEASFLEVSPYDATVDVPTPIEQPGTVIGPYKLMEQIGEGGMGVAYVAEQHVPVRRKVALKVIKPGMDTHQVIARFEAERQALALMDHPNIAKIFDGGVTDSGRPYFVMELVRGLPITEYCDAERLSVRERLELFVLVCRAVQHAHQKGIIHRDLKPSNILVTLHDGMPVPKVIDFGVAKTTGQSLTEKTLYTAFTQLVGTPLYMSPEQAELSDLDIDTRSDIYSLGVLLYELLTGTTPFDSDTLRNAAFDEMRRIIREEEPPIPSIRLSTPCETLTTTSIKRSTDPRQLNRSVRGELDWIAMKALEKDRKRRYETANDFAADVMRYLTDRPVEARSPSIPYRLRKFARRNRKSLTVATLLTALGVTLMASLGAFYLQSTIRVRRLTQDVRQSLAGARTAIEARDLTLAGQRVAEAQGRLGAEEASAPGLAAEVSRIRREISARQADEARFQQFLKVASDAQDKMSFGNDLGGQRIAEEALGLYGVLAEDDWSNRLESSYLTADQKRQVWETAYVTLVSLADYLVRWAGLREDPKTVQRRLDLLRRAESFHAPTRAFYFVRSECHRREGNTAASEEDVKRFKAAAAQTAWDYFLPGHTAGWNGDLEEAMRSYQAAFSLQPDHFNSLFFLAMRLATPKINRYAEAVAYFTACIAIRPDHRISYFNRAECHQMLGQLDAAEADYAAGIAKSSDEHRPDAYRRRAMFFDSLGRVEREREDILQAIALEEPLLEKRRATLGPDHHDTLAATYRLQEYYLASGRYRDAISLGEETLKRYQAPLGGRSPETLHIAGELALAYYNAGRSADAIKLLEEIIKRRGVGQDIDDDTLRSMRNLAGLYERASRFDESIALRRQVLDRLIAKEGPDHTQTLQSMNKLGVTYQDAGRFVEASALLERTLERHMAVLGPDHADTLVSMHNLASSYMNLNRVGESISLLKEVIGRAKPDNPNVLTFMKYLAIAYRVEGRLSESIELFRQVLERHKASSGPDHPETLWGMNNLASTYALAGELGESELLYRDLRERLRKGTGPKGDADLVPYAASGLGYTLLKQSKYVEAESIIRESLAICEKTQPEAWTTFFTKSLLGGSLLGQKKYADAEPLLLAGYEGMKKREKKIPIQGKFCLTEAVERLVQLYDAWGQKEKADAWRKKLPVTKSAKPVETKLK